MYRKTLIGNSKAILITRMQEINIPTSTKFDEQIDMDLARCFPTMKKHRKVLKDILKAYASSAVGVGYAQGINFLVCPLYNHLLIDNQEYALSDTFYCLQRVMRLVLPIYPLHNKDIIPLQYSAKVAELLRRDTRFPSDWLDVVQCFLLRFWPTMFSNMFNLDQIKVLWCYILTGKTDTLRLKRLYKIFLNMFKSNSPLYKMEKYSALKLLSNGDFHSIELLINYTQ